MKKSICLVLLFTSGCAPAAIKPEIVSSKVTVTTSGKQINDFESEFVHRASINSREVNTISNFDQVKDSYDQFGKLVGLQLLSDLPALFLQKDDILTAIGKKVIGPGDRFSQLKSQIKDGESSITFLRAGRAYKTLIQVAKSDKDRSLQ